MNARENFIYISNLAFLISVLSDSMIFCCGDLLPLLSSATSPDFSQDVIQPCGGMELETAFSFLNRVMSLVDTVVYTSNFSFGGVETNRNLSTGGFLRQCTRLGEWKAVFHVSRTVAKHRVPRVNAIRMYINAIKITSVWIVHVIVVLVW